MESIKSRNDTVHTYDEEEANKIYRQIIDQYHSAFLELETALLKEKEAKQFIMFGLDSDTIRNICLAKIPQIQKVFVWFTSQRQLQKWFRY